MKNFLSRIQPYLPSKKVALVGGVLLVGVIAFFVYKSSQNNTPLQALDISQIEDLRKSRQDTDSDGLFDWEEDLWHTSKTTADSDGDGTSDGDEIKQKRDPMIKGPADTISELQLRLVYTLPDANNQTQQMLNLAMPQIADVLTTSALNNTNISPQTAESIAENTVPTTPLTVNYTTKDLVFAKKFDKKSYMESIVNLQKNFQTQNDELSLLFTGYSEKDPNKLLALRSVSIRYENLAKAFVKLPTHRSLAQETVSLANYLSNLSGVVYDFSNTIDDPIKTLNSISTYEFLTEGVFKESEQLVTKFEKIK